MCNEESAHARTGGRNVRSSGSSHSSEIPRDLKTPSFIGQNSFRTTKSKFVIWIEQGEGVCIGYPHHSSVHPHHSSVHPPLADVTPSAGKIGTNGPWDNVANFKHPGTGFRPCIEIKI